MSAEMQKRVTIGAPATVPPQPVNDRSIIDSVAGFINEVASTNTNQSDSKNQIIWMQFEDAADISDVCLGEGLNGEAVTAPLLLILGYANGIQVWALPSSGEAIEVLSWRHGSFKCLRILPTPISGGERDQMDLFLYKRPLIALSEVSAPSNSSMNYSSVNFLSLKDGDQVKSIKFKNPVIDILANRSSVVVTFPEKVAVFDSKTLEDRLAITTCNLSPGINPNPIALGTRWLAYSEKKLHASKRSGGGFEGEGTTSYTATVLNAAKTLGKGLRGLGEQVAAGLTGNAAAPSSVLFSASGSPTDLANSGVITVLDIKNPVKEYSPTNGAPVSVNGVDPVVAHFVAHHDSVVAMKFDFSGTLLLTADKRGHDFNLFRIHPHPSGSALAAVHHLYVLHRGDTTSKVQDMSFSLDSRWVTVSTMRGTTHVFPITPYGGSVGIRTHCSPHVVNRLSRFHRSAGLNVDGRSSSPVNFTETAVGHQLSAYSNPRTPPYPHPTTICALAQIRQPFSLASNQMQTTKSSLGRQKTLSGSEDINKVVRVTAIFAKERSWLLDAQNGVRDTSNFRTSRKTIDSLFIMAGHGALVQYDLDPKPTSTIAKEKVCDETPLELAVEARAQWVLERPDSALDIQPPLPSDNLLLQDFFISKYNTHEEDPLGYGRSEKWLSQVEIVTHAGPHRRLWMGPLFMFKIYNAPSGSCLSDIDAESIEISANRVARSHPVNMPAIHDARSMTIESGSCSSHDQSPRTHDSYRIESHEDDYYPFPVESRLKDDIADAMRESPATNIINTGDSSSNSSCYGSTQNLATSTSTTVTTKSTHPSIVNIVNPLGTVTSVDARSEKIVLKSEEDFITHENCDETLFRPFVTVISEKVSEEPEKKISIKSNTQLPPLQGTLIVPVIDKTADESIKRKSQLKAARAEESVQAKKVEPVEVQFEETSFNVELKGEDEEVEEICFPTENEEVGEPHPTLLKESLLLSTAPILDTIYFPSLEPLEPLDDFLDSLEKVEAPTDFGEQNLIKLESPNDTEEEEKQSDSQMNLSQIHDGNIIFAICTSLKENNKQNGDVHEGQDSDYKSLETEDFMNTDSAIGLADNTSSDDNTESSTICTGKTNDDDEELTPLIKTAKCSEDIQGSENPSSSDITASFSCQLTPTHNGNGKKKSRRKRK